MGRLSAHGKKEAAEAAPLRMCHLGHITLREGLDEVVAFLDDMPGQFSEADLILARSGASTVAELAASGKPSLLIPFPQAADDHQRKNAEVLAQGGAARMLLEKDTTAGRLLGEVQALLGSPDVLQQMAVAARTFAHPRAGDSLWETGAAFSSN